MTENFFKNKKTAILVALFCMFLWGSAFPTVKLIYRELGILGEDRYLKILFGGWRFFTAGCLVLLYHLLLRKTLPDFRSVALRHLLVLGLLQTAIQYYFYNIGLGNTTGVKGAIIQASSTFFIVILAAVFLKDDRITLRKALALLIGFGGIVLSNLQGGFDFSFRMDGEGFLLLSTLSGSFGMIWVKKYCEKDDPFVLTAGQMILGSLLLIILGTLGKEHALRITPKAVLLFFYSGFISSTAFLLWYQLLKYHKAGEISLYRLFIPVFGSLLSVVVLGDPFTGWIFFGLVCVVAGMLILNVPQKSVRN